MTIQNELSTALITSAASEIDLPPHEPDQVVDRGQRRRERKERPVEAALLVADLAEVRVEPEAKRDGNRQRDDENDAAFQVRARITAAVVIHPHTATMIGTSVNSTCSGSSPRSSRCTSSR